MIYAINGYNENQAEYHKRKYPIFEVYFNWDNLKKSLGIKPINICGLDDLWEQFRARYCPSIITRYGTIGRELCGDERTLFTKFCDGVSDYLFKKRQKRRESRDRWNGFSFFDWGFGQNITNLGQIKDLERLSGKTFMSWKDREVEQDKANRQVKIDMQRKISKKLHYVLSEVQKGRKFTQEIKHNKREMIESFNRGTNELV